MFYLVGLGPLYIDRWYIILVIPAMLLAMIAQGLVKSRFQKFSQIRTSRGITGRMVAERILRENDVNDVRVEKVPGVLTDHFSPKEKVLRLSDPVYDSPTISAVGVAAHEAGHAIQMEQSYLPNRIRAFMFPVARIGSSAGPYLAIFGLMMRSEIMFNIGVILYAAAVLFFLVTLPVEFNASRRAIRILENGYLTDEELDGAKKVLRAAALTYVASAATAFFSLVRLILISRGRNSRD